MKKVVFFIALSCVFLFSACSKSGIKSFRGDYSFKTSGSVTIQRVTLPFDTITPPAITFSLPNEIGQLEITTLDKEHDSVLMVMNYLNNEVVVAQGCCKDNELIMKSFTRDALNFNVDSDLSFKAPVKVRAHGRLYDEDLLIIDMSYSGIAMVGPLYYHIEGDDIKMVANRN